MHRSAYVTFIILAATICLSPQILFAQEADSTAEDQNSILEKILERGTEDAESSQYVDELEQLEESPLDINTATAKELAIIPLMQQQNIEAILALRERRGEIASMDELRSLESIDDRLMLLLVKYCRVYQPDDESEFAFFERVGATLRTRAQQDEVASRGFTDGAYQGSRLKLYNRITATDDAHLSAAIISEKDAGETSIADHVAGHIAAKDLGILKTVIVGDYTVALGQGVAQWSASGISKGSEVITSPKRRNRMLRPFASAEENRFYRGVAAQAQLGGMDVVAFYSNHWLDASIDSTDATGFDESGLHRTLSEIDKQNTVNERIFGAAASTTFTLDRGSATIGVTGYSSSFDRALSPDNRFAFHGTSASMVGAHYDVGFGVYNLFGEWARSHSQSFGGVTGLSANLTRDVKALVVYRNYPADFVSIHGYAFGERNGATQNERGIYTGIDVKFSRFIRLAAYFDQFWFPGPSYFVPLPASGNEYFLQTEWRPMKRMLVTLRYKREQKDDQITTTDQAGMETRGIHTRDQKSMRFDVAYRLSKKLAVQFRGEYTDVGYGGIIPSEHGLLFFADLRIEPMSDLTISARLCSFNTTSYESRVYEFERDIPGVLTNSGLYGKGIRFYLLAGYRILERLQLSARYSRTVKEGIRSLGSGNDEVLGDAQGRFGVQLDVRL